MTKRLKPIPAKSILRLSLISMLGPALALLVSWQPVLEVTNISAGTAPSLEVVEQLRSTPDDSIFTEIRGFAVGTPSFRQLEPEELLRNADEVFADQFVSNGDVSTVDIVADRRSDIFRQASSDLWIKIQ